MLIRGLKKGTLERLRASAKRNGRSAQSEARLILERATGNGPDIRALVDKWRKRFAGRKFGDSADLIREDRDR